MKLNLPLVFISLLLLSKISMAQNQSSIDSLIVIYKAQNEDSLKVKTAHAIYEFYKGHKPKVAIQYNLEGLALAKKIDFKKAIARSYQNIGSNFRRTRKLDSAKIYFNKALDIYKHLKDEHQIGMMTVNFSQLLYLEGDYKKAIDLIDNSIERYSSPKEDSLVVMSLLQRKAIVLMRQTEYEKGFEVIFKALAYSEKLKLPIKRAQILGTVAGLYHYTDNKEKAIALKKEALIIQRKENNKSQIALSLNDLGNSHYVLKEYDLALKYLEESLPISRELELNGLIGITTFNIGKTYIRKGQIQKGIKFLEESIHYSRYISHNSLSESWALKRLGDVYTEELNMPKMALPFLNRAIVLADSIGNKDDLYQSYRDRSQAYAALGQYKKALEDHESYKALNDTVYNIEKSNEIERLKTEFETKEKEQQIALQENEIDLLEQKDKVSNLQKSLLGGGLLLALGIVGVGFYGFRQKTKRTNLEKEKVDAELAFKKKELTAHALHLAKKNEVLEGLKLKAEELKSSESNQNGYQQLIRTINFDLQDDNNWENFSKYFQEVHKDFNKNVKLKFPEVTSNELRLMSLLKMNLTSKEIANILNISQEGIKKARYRLRKKLNITTEESLQDLVFAL